jgi:phosphoribosylamine--glycine ligase
MMRLQSDLVNICLATVNKTLSDNIKLTWDPRPALGVVLAAGGYPFKYRKGDLIHGLPSEPSLHEKTFYAGVDLVDDNIVTNGGRVLCATALGENIQQAQKNAYALVRSICWDVMYYRNDIGHRAITAIE